MRPLSASERQVLDVMLTLDFPGVVELRAQVDAARVTRQCDCGCPSIDLVVEGDVPLAKVVSRTPANAEVDGVLGGGLVVFVDDGRLSGLEYYWAEDAVPGTWPNLDRIRPYT